MRQLQLAATTLICGVLVAGCYPEPVALTTPPPTPIPRVTILPTAVSSPPVTATTSPPSPPPLATTTPIPLSTPSSTQAPDAGGSPSARCINGWSSPIQRMPEYDEGIAILEGHMGVAGPWTVMEMRYFTGPDSPGVIEPRFDAVERWYLKATLAGNPAFRGRWLLEKRTDQILGVSAVAPWESFGYESPDWTGFIGEGEPQTYIGLPGQWSGIPFDFVTGAGDGGQPGLPPEVIDCLAAT